ncbi:hypothetical protein AB205_0063500 [Aquarana catesbeiana]|uniref:Uncharacterized protein n=1 Tax=Aquarana catesbeiana TaxID=8400 RepID=A0A2G9QAP6_AQUCT|nr:hypothetical protein AB205_0063500 [Aquarana catesbeiana]
MSKAHHTIVCSSLNPKLSVSSPCYLHESLLTVFRNTIYALAVVKVEFSVKHCTS